MSLAAFNVRTPQVFNDGEFGFGIREAEEEYPAGEPNGRLARSGNSQMVKLVNGDTKRINCAGHRIGGSMRHGSIETNLHVAEHSVTGRGIMSDYGHHCGTVWKLCSASMRSGRFGCLEFGNAFQDQVF